ncbi:hypothetical protein H6784_05030 [Candidatus Nomurabacteria bacterium]|nr:hypothetical protein [Candidatus Nomurabacteria bacterium]
MPWYLELFRILYKWIVEKLKVNHITKVDQEYHFYQNDIAEFSQINLEINPLKQYIYIVLRFAFWIIFVIFLIWVFAKVTDVDPSGLNNILIFYGLMLTTVVAVTTYGKAAILHRRYGGFGGDLDNFLIDKHKHTIILNKNGIFGMVKILWFEVEKVEEIGELRVKISKKKVGKLPSFLQLPPLIIVFPSVEDKTRFMEGVSEVI